MIQGESEFILEDGENGTDKFVKSSQSCGP